MTSAKDGGNLSGNRRLPALRSRNCGNREVEEFHRVGFKPSDVFPHRVLYLPRCGPDGYKLAKRMFGLTDPARMYETVLYAQGPVLERFPPEIFFDDDLVWHQQQLGIPGHVALVNMVLTGDELYTTCRFSDLWQRIGRRRDLKTQVENRFQGWTGLILNAVMGFAVEHSVKRIVLPTADLALAHTDRKRNVQRMLFDRVYDRALLRRFSARRRDATWVVDVAENRHRFVPLPLVEETNALPEKTVCVCHDIERGLGHVGIDDALARRPVGSFQESLDKMLSVEAAHAIRATYNVVGSLLPEVRPAIEAGGHCIAFHSFDHDLSARQLHPCRVVDYRIKGYRTPRSVINGELTDEALCQYNFEWLASSTSSLQITEPALKNGVVRIPILLDDFSMYKAGLSYDDWEEKALARIADCAFAAFSLHDCYAQHWLPRYGELLEKIKCMGELTTLNEVADRVILASAL